MEKIKFENDSWNGIIAKDFTFDNLARVTEATAKWMTNKNYSSVVIGFDTRFNGKVFAQHVAAIMATYGFKVFIAEDFVTTPMVCLGVIEKSADLGIVITGSQSSPLNSGYKLRSKSGAPLKSNEIINIEELVSDELDLVVMDYERYESKGDIEIAKLEDAYFDHISSIIDFPAIVEAGLMLVFDGMFGSGQRIIQRFIPGVIILHCQQNPSYEGQAPLPSKDNLTLMSQLVAATPYTCCGLATDGDACGIAICDEEGKMLERSEIMLLLLHDTIDVEKESGDLLIDMPITDQLNENIRLYFSSTETFRTEFDEMIQQMESEDYLLAMNNFHGVAISTLIPDFDGMYMGLKLLELVAHSGKKPRVLLNDIYAAKKLPKS